MAIAVASVSNTPLHGSRTNTTITAPTGITNGDLLVAVLFVGHASTLPLLTVTPPAGWSEETNSPSGIDDTDPYEVSIRVYHKVASGESGDYTFTHAAAETQGYMYRLTGADTSNPIDATPAATQYSSSNGQTTTYGSVTTVTNGCFLIFCEADWDGPGSGTVSGSTPTIALRRAGTVTWLGDGTQTTAGATGSRTRINGNSGATGRWASLVVPIRPASGGSTTNKTVSINCTATVSAVKQARKIAAITAAATVAAVKQARKIINIAATTTVAAVKQARKIVNIAATGTVAAIKQARKTLSINSTATVSAVKSVAKSIAVAAAVTVKVTTIRVFLKTVNIDVSATVAVVRAVFIGLLIGVATSIAVVKTVNKTVDILSSVLIAIQTGGSAAFEWSKRVVVALLDIRKVTIGADVRSVTPTAETRTVIAPAEDRSTDAEGI